MAEKKRRTRSTTPPPAKRARQVAPPAQPPPPPQEPVAPTEPTITDDLLLALAAPFPADDVEWRVQQSGVTDGKPWLKVVPYITNRAIMHRLDALFGLAGWRNEFREVQFRLPVSENAVQGFLCGLSVRMPNGEWVTKWDGADLTDIVSLKGGLSDAMKRTAVHFGIGRYLYKLDDGWATPDQNGRYFSSIGKGDGKLAVKWNPPALPKWALPNGTPTTATRTQTNTTPSAADIAEARKKWLAEMERLLADPLVTDEDREAAADWQKENVNAPLDVLREKVNGIQKALAVRKRRAMAAEAQAGKAQGAASASTPSAPTPAPAKPTATDPSPVPSEPAKSGAEIPVSERATKAQRGLFLKMLQSHVFSDEERRIAKVACDDPMLSKTDLSGLIDNASKLSKQRKELEKKAKEEAVARLKEGGYGD